MSWAARRRFVILFSIGAVIAAFFSVILISAFYESPSCTDGKHNQGEAGTDCGGPCAYLCIDQLQPPTVLFTKAFPASTGRTVVVAAVENKNFSAAANDVPFSIILYGAGQTLVQTVSGSVDLPPGVTQTIFVSGIQSGKQAVTSAFLTIDAAAPKWFALSADPRIMPTVSNTIQSGSVEAPRIDATLVNGSVTALTDVPVVVIVRDAEKRVVASSETIVPVIPPQGSAVATFTWSVPFSAIAASIEVSPLVPLPETVVPR